MKFNTIERLGIITHIHEAAIKSEKVEGMLIDFYIAVMLQMAIENKALSLIIGMKTDNLKTTEENEAISGNTPN
jgi:hypothetical protein